MASARVSVGVAVVLGAFVGAAACEAPLPAWDAHAGSPDSAGPADATGEPRLAFDPPAAFDAVTRVTRIRVELAAPLASPRVLLVEGPLTSAQLRDLARPVVTQTLLARAQPALVWTSAQTLVIAPLQVLASGTVYTVGVSDPPIALSFTIAADDETPILSRVWPDPEDATSPATAAVWCGQGALAAVDGAATLAPAESAGRLVRGTGATVQAARCVSWFALPPAATTSPSPATPAVTPAWVPLAGGAIALLEPALLWPDAHLPPSTPPPNSSPPSSAPPCDPIDVRFGPGCATVDDDRIVVRPPAGPVLWTIDAGAETIVRRSRGERSFVVRPLPSDARIRLAALDESGRLIEGEVTVHPAAPRPHVIINEVMANPAGAERAQEWVELFNDGLLPVALAGYGLETGGGTTVLPAEVLAPGAFALVVNDTFVHDDGSDPVAAPGTLIVRVPALGRDGLSNEGERLVLRDGAGAVLSTFPSMKTKNGVSNARLAPDAPDADADSFAPSANGSATPGAPNAGP